MPDPKWVGHFCVWLGKIEKWLLVIIYWVTFLSFGHFIQMSSIKYQLSIVKDALAWFIDSFEIEKEIAAALGMQEESSDAILSQVMIQFKKIKIKRVVPDELRCVKLTIAGKRCNKKVKDVVKKCCYIHKDEPIDNDLEEMIKNLTTPLLNIEEELKEIYRNPSPPPLNIKKIQIVTEKIIQKDIKKSINVNIQIRKGIINRNIPNKDQSVSDLVDDLEVKNIKIMLFHVWDSLYKDQQYVGYVGKNEQYELIKEIEMSSISIHNYNEFDQISQKTIPKIMMKINLNELWKPFGEYHLIYYVKNRPANPFYKIKRLTYDIITQEILDIDASINEFERNGDRRMWTNVYSNFC